MEKRYQVFISSTFRDLVYERQSVLKAVLELDHMPAGMELFPATDDTAWQLIKDIIHASDYYVLILGGRYGSLDETGIGYTQKEYDYSIASKKPAISLLHANPNNLPRDRTEIDQAAWNKLVAFRKKVENKHTCAYWMTAQDLKSQVIVGLTSTIKKYPGVGWVRADQVPPGATLVDILTLKDRIAHLESELQQTQSQPLPDSESLSQGDDTISISLDFAAVPSGAYYPETKYKATINPTWDDVFAAIAPAMINEASGIDVKKVFRSGFSDYAREEFSEEMPGEDLKDFSFSDHDFDTCIIQLRALGLIRKSDRKRSIKDTSIYWKLTPYGDRKMLQLRAVRRIPAEHHRIAGSTKSAKVDDGDDDFDLSETLPDPTLGANS